MSTSETAAGDDRLTATDTERISALPAKLAPGAGCGPGHVAGFLSDLDVRVAGFDLNESWARAPYPRVEADARRGEVHARRVWGSASTRAAIVETQPKTAIRPA